MLSDEKIEEIAESHIARLKEVGHKSGLVLSNDADLACADAIREALRAAEQVPVMGEPVAYAAFNKHGDPTRIVKRRDGWCKFALYVTPPTSIAAAELESLRNGVAGLDSAQEPKYTTDGTSVINRASGEAIPSDEPVFIFRARDKYALSALTAYVDALPQGIHRGAVMSRIADFLAFSENHSDRMKEPDTAAMQERQP